MQMNPREIEERLRAYHPRDCRVTVERVAYSGDSGFEMGLFGMPAAGIPFAKIDAKSLRRWKIRLFLCIDLTLSAGPGSEFQCELLLPERDWNGKAVFVGNGGQAGTLLYQTELAFLYEPYAVIHCNLGTSDIDAGLSSSSAIIDFGWRATHLSTVVGKDVIALVYGRPILHTYCVGMSTGGQQGIAAATVCPEDFDGIVAIAPGISRSRLHPAFIWYTRCLVREDGTSKFSLEEIAKIHKVILDYHGRHGYGAPGDPFVSVLFSREERQEILKEIERACRFSPDQIRSLRAFYQGPVDPETGEKIFSGFAPGAECNALGMVGHILPELYAGQIWLGAWMTGMTNRAFNSGGFRQFDFAKHGKSPMARRIATDMDADSGDLAAFRARGGKLLVIQGIEDEFIPPENIVDWYERVVSRQGGLEIAQTFCRLFLVPGNGHSWIQDGINWISDEEGLEESLKFYRDLLAIGCGLVPAIDRWVCREVPPDRLIGTSCSRQGVYAPDISSGITRQRPLYPYPDMAEYVSGDPDLLTSFRRKRGTLGHYEKPCSGRYAVN